MKKIAIIGSVGLPAKYGGWETLVDNLTSCLKGQFEFTVFCSAKKYEKKLVSYNDAILEYINLNANGVQSILYDLVSLLKALRFADVILVLGVSGCIFLPVIKLFTRKKIIVNIDGLEWRRAKWGRFAKWFLKMSEAAAVRSADVVVADNQAIQRYLEVRYGKTGKLIAYGSDHALHQDFDDQEKNKYIFSTKRYAFKVCRIEPENNIDIILQCFKNYDNIDLVIIGNWNNSKYGINLKKYYCNFSHIHLLDPIYDQIILNKIRSNCYVYIHGHSAGGTNPSLVEAMHLGLPIISFSCDFNKFTMHEEGLFFNNSEELVDILVNTDAADFNLFGIKMKVIADEFYTWHKISEKYAELF